MAGNSAADAAKVMQLGMGFCGAQVLLTANDLGLFDILAEGPASGTELRDRLRLSSRSAGHFLQALVRLGMIEVADGEYRNSELAGQHLVRGRPAYMGGFLTRARRVLYPAWGRLGDMLRTGEPQADSHSGGDLFGSLYEQQDNMLTFLDMMDAVTSVIGPELADALDWEQYRTVVDIGGARGNLLAYLLKAQPHLTATVFDLPQMRRPFRDYMASVGSPETIRFHAGDFFRDELPAADVVIFGHVLEDWAPEQRQALLNRAYAAVRPGGAVIIYDPMLDERLNYVANVMASLSLMLMTHGGCQYSLDECAAWLRKAGFGDISSRPLASNDMLVVANRPE